MNRKIQVIVEEEKSLLAHSKAIRDLIFVSPSILATGSYDNDFSIKLWDVPSFELLQKLVGHKGKIRNIRYSEKLKILASSGDDCTVILWKRLARAKWVILKTIPGKEFMTWGLLFDETRKYLFTGCSHYIEIFHIKNGVKKIRSIQIREEHIYGHHVIYSILKYDERRILAADNEKIILWDYIRGQKLADVNAHNHYIYRLQMFNFSNNQYIISSSEDKYLKFWKLEVVNKKYKIDELVPPVTFGIALTGLTVLPEYGLIGMGLSSGIDGRGKLLLIDCKERKLVKEYIFDDIEEKGCLCVAWEPKNRNLAAGYWNGKLKLLKLKIN